MPVDTHLEWFEITDWSPGLYDNPATLARRLLMPENASQELVDYVPQEQGGLRAFYAPTTVSTTGISDITNEAVSGMFERGGLVLRSGAAGDSFDRFITTIHKTDFKTRLYRMDGTNGETTWKQDAGPPSYTGQAGTNGLVRMSEFDFMKTTAGVEYVLLVVRDLSTTGASPLRQGLWAIRYTAGAGPPATDGDLSNIGVFTGPLAVAQARILVGAGNSERLHYGTIGDIVVTGTTFIDVEPNKLLPNLAMIEPFAPGDIMVAKEGGPWVVIGGDVSSASTPIREMGHGHHPRYTDQEPIRTPDGLVFIEPDGHVYRTDGRSFENLSPNLALFPGNLIYTAGTHAIVGVGRGAWINQYLFMPGGYVMHWPTKSWFKVASFDASFWHANLSSGRVFGAAKDVSFALKTWRPFDGIYGESTTRVSTAYFRTAPYSRPDGRQVEIREVQLFVNTYGSSTVDVVVNGTTKTIASIAAGRHQLSFLFRERDEMLDVKVTGTNNAGGEAPTIERMRIAFGMGHSLPHGTFS